MRYWIPMPLTANASPLSLRILPAPEGEFIAELDKQFQTLLQSKTLADLAEREAQLRANKKKKRR